MRNLYRSRLCPSGQGHFLILRSVDKGRKAVGNNGGSRENIIAGSCNLLPDDGIYDGKYYGNACDRGLRSYCVHTATGRRWGMIQMQDSIILLTGSAR